MTEVTILYFAAVRELAGVSEERLQLPANIDTVARLVTHLEALHAPLAGRLRSVRVARNETFVDATEPLSDGDTIALIPPVSGG
ncbi:MAG TPA: molybdopterin converting factor subunit 1 [Polyangiaceae bacterium]|nr:molybdopterin converting factor subunit 1 [Polyangiaceae bacterium]